MRQVIKLAFVLLLLSGSAYAQGTSVYLPANNLTAAGTGCVTSGTSVLKGNGSGGCGNALAGTDYLSTGSVGGDCTFTSPSTFTCTKTNGVPFAAVATSASASDLTSGTLANNRLPPNIAVTTLSASSLNAGQCVQASTGGLLTSTGAACGAGSGGGGSVLSGSGPQMAQYPAGTSTSVSPVTISGDGQIAQGGSLTVTKTGGVAFANSATQDTTNAANISTGILPAGRMALGLNTPPTAGQVPVGNSGGTAFVNQNMSGDVTLAASGVATVQKINGNTIAPSATTDTTNATNITSGTLAAARGGAGTTSGILKANGSGTVSAAVSGTDYQAPIAGNTLASHNFANSINATGTISGAQPAASDITGLAASATTDTTNAANILSGTLNNSRLPANISVTNLTASALTSGQCVQATTGGLLASSGASCGAGAGSGTVASGTGPAIAQYPSGTGTTVNPVTVSGDASIANGGALSVSGLHFGATDIQTSGTAPTTNQCLAYDGTNIVGTTCGSGGGTGTIQSGSNPQIPQYVGSSSIIVGPVTISGDATMANGGALTVSKTGGVAFATSATTDTTNASNINSGSLSRSRLPSPVHTLAGSTPVAVVASATIGSLDIEDLPLSTNVASFTLPAAGALADGEELIVKIRQPAAGGPWTLPAGSAGTIFTAGAGTVIVNGVSSIGGCPAIGTSAGNELFYDLLYRQSLTEWVVAGCFTNPPQNFPYDVAFSMSGIPAANQIFPTVTTRQINFAANFTNSQASCGTNPSELDTYTVKCGGSTIGTVALSTGCVPAFTTTGGTAQVCTGGNRLELDAPATVSGSNIGITLVGTR